MNYEDICSLISGKFISKISNDYFLGKFKVNSKEVHYNDCFIAINNGYKYIDDAIEKGAKLIITEKEVNNKNANIIKVDNIIKTLGVLADEIRKKHNNKDVIAITGSVGKTTTKELISLILSKKYKVLKTKGNMNNEIGVPVTLFNLDDTYDICVLELGMNHLKEISYLSKIIKPNTAIITNIGTSHIGYLKSKKNIFKAKCEILDGVKDGFLFINGDDKYLKRIKYKNIYLVGLSSYNNLVASNIITTKNKLYFNIKYENRRYNVVFNIPNKALVNNILIAIAVGLKYQIDICDIIKSIKEYEPIECRNKVISLKNNIILIDDCYNCSYESFKAGIEQLKYYNYVKLIIFGDILELGRYGKKIHKKIGKLLEEKKYTSLLVGKEVKYSVNKYSLKFNNNNELINYLETINLKYIVIYIKGSHGMKLEEIRDYIIKKY